MILEKKEKLKYNLLNIISTKYKNYININHNLIKIIWDFLNDYDIKIIKIQKFWKKYIRCNIHITSNAQILNIISSFPELEPRRLIRQSSMGCEHWCCPYKNGFISPMLPEFRKIQDRTNLGTLVTFLYKNRLLAYGYKSAEELKMYPLQTFVW